MKIQNKEDRIVSSEIQRFPPRLRRIAQHIFNSNKLLTVDDAIRELSVNRKSVYNGISLCKRKGNDFYEFLNRSFQLMLSKNKYAVGQSLVRRAVSGVAAHQKLFFKLTGDLEENAAAPGITIKHLTIGINQLGTRPSDLSKEKGIIDLDPEIPKNKTGL